jgi:hypothetical protein
MARLRRKGSAPPDSTVALRRRLKADREAGTLGDAASYTRWLVEQSPDLGIIPARRVVYRELRRYKPKEPPSG